MEQSSLIERKSSRGLLRSKWAEDQVQNDKLSLLLTFASSSRLVFGKDSSASKRFLMPERSCSVCPAKVRPLLKSSL